MREGNVWRSARVGINLKKDDINRPWFYMKEYRYLARPDLLKKNSIPPQAYIICTQEEYMAADTLAEMLKCAGRYRTVLNSRMECIKKNIKIGACARAKSLRELVAPWVYGCDMSVERLAQAIGYYRFRMLKDPPPRSLGLGENF